MSDSEAQIYAAISEADILLVQELLKDQPASSFSKEQSSRFLGKAVASRMPDLVRTLLKHGFMVTDLDAYTRRLPATLGQREMARLLQ